MACSFLMQKEICEWVRQLRIRRHICGDRELQTELLCKGFRKAALRDEAELRQCSRNAIAILSGESARLLECGGRADAFDDEPIAVIHGDCSTHRIVPERIELPPKQRSGGIAPRQHASLGIAVSGSENGNGSSRQHCMSMRAPASLRRRSGPDPAARHNFAAATMV